MNLGITGITGFVGSNLKNILNQKYDIFGVGRTARPTLNIVAYEEIGSVMQNCDAFIHLAGKAHDLKGVVDENAYFEVNTELTKTLFDEFLKSNCRVFIYFSSVKAAADKVIDVLTEESVPAPKTAYGKSKLAAEQYLLSKEITAGKKVYVLRPCLIHGANNKGNLHLLHSFVKKGIPYPLKAFQNKRSYLGIDNLGFIVDQLIMKSPTSGIYNVADDEAISTCELVKIIGQSIGKNTRIWYIPKFAILFLANIGTILKLPLTKEKLQKLTENYVVSNTKIKKALETNLPDSTLDGLKKTFSSFKN